MTSFDHGFRRLLTAPSPALGRKRMAGVFIAWWALFLAASLLSPCCDILAAAGPHGHSLQSTPADNDADHAAGDRAPHPQCATISDIDMVVPNGTPLLVAQLQLPDAPWLPAAARVSAPVRQSQAFHTGYPQPPPPPLPRLYLRTARLLI